jgi:hypothetical protein
MGGFGPFRNQGEGHPPGHFAFASVDSYGTWSG